MSNNCISHYYVTISGTHKKTKNEIEKTFFVASNLMEWAVEIAQNKANEIGLEKQRVSSVKLLGDVWVDIDEICDNFMLQRIN